MRRDKTEFAILPAFHGDCIFIKTFDQNNEEFNILIDGGTAQTFRYSLRNMLTNNIHINLIVLTHIDSDHISGLIKLFESSIIDKLTIDEIWMNYPELVETNNGELISIRQGNNLKDLILKKKPEVKLVEISTDIKQIVKSGLKFEILSPTPEIKNELYSLWKTFKLKKRKSDYINISVQRDTYPESFENLNRIPFSPNKSIKEDIFNSSSIAFILECPDVSLLLLGDSRPEVIVKSLKENGYNQSNPIEIDYVKISHHGSLNNTSQELLSLIRSNNFIISTNGGTANHKSPSRETIARIVYSSSNRDERINIFFNYEIGKIKQRAGNFVTDNDFVNKKWNLEHKNWFRLI